MGACLSDEQLALCRGVWYASQDSEPPQTPVEILKPILKGQFEAIVKSGGTVLISTSDEGQSASFSIPAGLDPKSLLTDISAAIGWFIEHPEPTEADFACECVPRLQAVFVSRPPT